MNWTDSFSQRTAHMRRSAIRELLKLTAQPEMISFAGGLPAPELFPVSKVQSASDTVLSQQGARALQYGETEGIGELRDWIAARHSTPNRILGRDNVLVTSGAQQALDLFGQVFLDPQDRVVTENPTYLAALLAWRPLGVEICGLTGDDDGLLLPELERWMPGAKAAYVMPNFQNPGGTTLELERRRRLVQLARANGTVVLEDDPYGLLRYSGEPLPSMFELDALEAGLENRPADWNVVHVGTFSKVIAPGLRLGWALGPAEVIDKMVQAKQAADLHTSTLAQLIVMNLLDSGLLERQVPLLCSAYGERRDAMLAALRDYMPAGIQWTRPDGGMFLFATLPREWDATALLAECLNRKTAYVPGEEFHTDGNGRNTLRLNFSNASPVVIREGIRRIAAVFAARAQSVTATPECPTNI